jgi:hypothetical protein
MAPRGPSFAVPDFGVANKPPEWPRKCEKKKRIANNQHSTSK